MELKQGYKQTEVGTIPEDWELRLFGDICRVNQGLQIAIEKRLKNPTPNAKKYITIQFLNNAKDIEYIDDYSPSVCCSESDVLMTRTGNTGIVVTGVDGVFHNNFFKINFDSSRLHKDYLTSYLSSSNTRKAILIKAGTSTIPDLNHHDFYSLPIPIPSILEQRAIATALSDVDALLAAQDKLITKKRDIKQAAMQNLLTGKQRLPGFTGEWEVKQLGEIFDISAGKSKSAYIATGGRYWIVDMGSVSTDGKLIVTKQTNFYGDFLKSGDLVMPKDDIGGGGIIGKVGYIDADETYVLGDHVYRLSANIGSSLFLTYLINSYRINTQLKKKVIGSAQLGLGRKSVEEQEIPFPSIEEQTAIATILYDMDADITALEQQRDKTRALKQGMMQELLTGRIRLVNKEDRNA